MSSEGTHQTRPPSTATVAFTEALALVASHRPTGADAARGPAFRYEPPGSKPWASNGRPGDAGDGPGLGPWEGGAIASAHRRMMTGHLSATELVEQALLAAEKQGTTLGAVVELLSVQALEEAARLDRLAEADGLGSLGSLHGIPITVKDIIHVAGVPTRAGSAAYYAVPDRDAIAVARARAAGAIVVAKVSTHEFALGVTTPQSANPFDHRRIPGGSSGGSAIAVACGIGLASIGTDTRASIRVPAALCGVVGLKGTFGLVPTEGIVPLSWTMDHVAPMATTVADAALLLEVMAGRPLGGGGGWPGGSTAGGGGSASARWARGSGGPGAPLTGGRIGLARAGFEGCEPSIAQVAMTAVAALVNGPGRPDGSDGADGSEGSGVRRRLVQLDRPNASDLDLANAAGLIVSRCEAAAFHRSLDADRGAYWDEVRDQLDAADNVGARDYLDAQRLRATLVADLRAVFERCDVLCLPTVGIAPPLRDDYTRFLTVLSRSCVPWSLAGFPAVSVPCGVDAAGFPVGLQIVGSPGADATVIAAAAEVERAAAASSSWTRGPEW